MTYWYRLASILGLFTLGFMAASLAFRMSMGVRSSDRRWEIRFRLGDREVSWRDGMTAEQLEEQIQGRPNGPTLR